MTYADGLDVSQDSRMLRVEALTDSILRVSIDPATPRLTATDPADKAILSSRHPGLVPGSIGRQSTSPEVPGQQMRPGECRNQSGTSEMAA